MPRRAADGSRFPTCASSRAGEEPHLYVIHGLQSPSLGMRASRRARLEHKLDRALGRVAQESRAHCVAPPLCRERVAKGLDRRVGELALELQQNGVGPRALSAPRGAGATGVGEIDYVGAGGDCVAHT